MTHDVGMKTKEPMRLRHKPQTWSYLICGKWPTFAPASKKVGRLMDSQFSKDAGLRTWRPWRREQQVLRQFYLWPQHKSNRWHLLHLALNSL